MLLEKYLIKHYIEHPCKLKEIFHWSLLSGKERRSVLFVETCKPSRRLGCKLKRETPALPIEIFSMMTAGESFKSDNEKVGNKGDEGKMGWWKGVEEHSGIQRRDRGNWPRFLLPLSRPTVTRTSRWKFVPRSGERRISLLVLCHFF